MRVTIVRVTIRLRSSLNRKVRCKRSHEGSSQAYYNNKGYYSGCYSTAIGDEL